MSRLFNAKLKALKGRVVKTDFELVDCKTGRCLCRGSRESCLSHILNDSMTIVLSHESAKEYRKEICQRLN